MATEEYANVATTTVSSGGTDAPASGTSESWTVASSTPFPAASTGSVQFHVADPAASSEMMLVTNISGTTWTVTRGAESTTPVTHTAGFTIWLVVTAGDLTALATSASVTAAVATETSRAEAAEATKGPILTQATVQTGNANALANTIVPTNTTSGSLTITLPNAPAAGTIVAVKMVIQGSTNTTTVACSGSDVFNKSGGGTSLTLSLLNQGILLQYNSGIWIDLADDLPLSQLENLFLQISNNLNDVGNRQTALNNLAGAVTSGYFLRGNGSNVSMSAIQAADLPAGTTSAQGALQLDGTAGDIHAVGASASAGSVGKAADAGHIHVGLLPSNNLSDVSSESTAFNNLSPMTTLGDSLYGGASGAATRLAGNTTTTRKFWRQTGTGSASAAPVLDTLQAADVPADLTGTGGPTAGGLGLVLQSLPLFACGAVSGGVANERALWMLVTAAVSGTVSKLGCILGTGGVTPGAGINGLGLFTEAGVLLSDTGDMTTAFESIGVAEASLGSAQTITEGVNYYLCFVSSFTGTQPGPYNASLPSPVELNGHYVTVFAASYASWASFTPSSATANQHPVYIYGR